MSAALGQRLDMVNLLRRSQPPGSLALLTQRVRRNVAVADSLPCQSAAVTLFESVYLRFFAASLTSSNVASR
jgi:hypothetical protein